MGKLHERVWHRNQLETALWRHAVTFRHWGADPDGLVSRIPSIFRSRIKKMLNLDRIPEMTPWEDLGDQWAFYDDSAEGTGSEERFSVVHVFLMGTALNLLDIGLKQSEVIFFLKHLRPDLEVAFEEVHRRHGSTPPVSESGRQKRFAKHFPDAEPLWPDPNKEPQADFTVWMLVRRSENQEAYPGFQRKIGEREIPLFMEPKICFGLEAVKSEVFSHLSQYPHVVMVELADLALTVPKYLAEAPVIGRGRPKGITRRKSRKSS